MRVVVKKSFRVAVAGITFETNSFAPGLTEMAAFQRYLIVSGEGVLTAGLGKDEIAGALSVAEAEGIELVPVFAADGGCGPTVSDDTYEFLKARLLKELDGVINEVDGIYLRLHGAMVTQSLEDVEGDLIAAVRSRVSSDFPIAVSCDFHAHFTAKMVEGTQLIAGYQTCPHTDFFETGARAMKLMVAALSGKAPTLSYRKLKLLASAEGHDTSIGPMREVLDQLHEIEKLPEVLDATVFATQPWLEVEELGWSALVITENDPELGQVFADQIANMMWDRRVRFLIKKENLEDVLPLIAASGPDEYPYVLGDGADSPSAGSSGDSAYLLAKLKEFPIDGKVFMSITDAPAAERCFKAGLGEELTLSLGGTIAPNFFDSVTVTGRVATLSDGIYQSKYPSKIFNSGPTVLFQVGLIEIVITSKPAFMLDYQLYLKMGLDISTAKIVQTKSAGGYRAYYEPLAFKCIDFVAPGPSDSRLPNLPFTRPRRPLWPFDKDIEDGWY
jgi:microcystin degradation protein MlrC